MPQWSNGQKERKSLPSLISAVDFVLRDSLIRLFSVPTMPNKEEEEECGYRKAKKKKMIYLVGDIQDELG